MITTKMVKYIPTGYYIRNTCPNLSSQEPMRANVKSTDFIFLLSQAKKK